MRKCTLCSKEYEYCPSCAEFASEPKWKFLFHDENCMNIFHAVSDYLLGENSKEKTLSLLSKYDISHPERFNEKTQRTLMELYTEDKKSTPKIKADLVKRVKVSKENE